MNVREKKDRILSAWSHYGTDLVKFMDILRYLEEQRIFKKEDRPKSQVTLTRWLNSLVNNGDLLKDGKQGYKILRDPTEFHVFDYLSRLREKYDSSIGSRQSGKEEWHRSLLLCLGLNKDISPLAHTPEAFAFELLSKRLTDIFEALHLLRNTLLLRRVFFGTNMEVPFFKKTIEEVYLSAISERIIKSGETKAVVEKLGLAKKEGIRELSRSTESERSKGSANIFSLLDEYAGYLDANGEWFSDFSLKDAFVNLDWYKETLRRKKIRIERKDLSDLVKKYVPIHQRVEASEQAMFEKEETEPTSEEEWRMRDKLPLYRLAVLAKIASFMRELHLDLDDFAVVLTRHKESMARYSAIEGELYRERGRIKNTIEGKPPNVKYELIEEFCRADPLKILAENLVETQVDISEFEKLKDRFWVRIEFGKDYEKFLSYYRSEMRREKKRKKKIVADAMRAKEKRAKSAAVKERHANLGEDRE